MGRQQKELLLPERIDADGTRYLPAADVSTQWEYRDTNGGCEYTAWDGLTIFSCGWADHEIL